MYLYTYSNSSNLYCSSNPRFYQSCTSCINVGGSAGCGWCLQSSSCETKQNCRGEWVSPNDVCVHDKLFTMIILIIVLIIIVILILLLFFIYYSMDICINNILRGQSRRNLSYDNCSHDYQDKSRLQRFCYSDDSYIYGKNLSLGRTLEKLSMSKHLSK